MLFDSLVLSILNENPDRVANIYDRNNNDYNQFIFFIGDENGSFLKKKTKYEETHSFVLKDLKELGIILPKDRTKERPELHYGVSNDPKILQLWTEQEDHDILGNPQTISSKHSGIIMPKQSDMNGTYISFWYFDDYSPNSPALKQLYTYTKKNFPGPYFIDKAPPFSEWQSPSKVIPL